MWLSCALWQFDVKPCVLCYLYLTMQRAKAGSLLLLFYCLLFYCIAVFLRDISAQTNLDPSRAVFVGGL